MKKHDKRNSKRKQKWAHWPFGDSLSPVYGETSLWAAVITQAMMDALTKSRNMEAQHHRHEAIRWLTGNSKDFVTVCLMAGYDPDYIRKKAKKAIANPKPWRAAPGKGKRYEERKRKRQQPENTVHAVPVLHLQIVQPAGYCHVEA